MKRLARLAARLYPRGWSARYAEEFDALLDDVDAGWLDVLDIIAGALTMQLRVHGLALAGWTALGALVGLVISLQMTPLYTSSGVVRLRLPNADARLGPAQPPHDFDGVFASAFTDASLERLALSEGLVSAGGSVGSTHDAVRQIRSSTLVKIASQDDGVRAETVEVGFRDADRARSQRVSRRLLELLITANFAKPTSAVVIQVLTPPPEPTSSSRPSLVAMTSAAATLGLLIGAVVLFRRKSPGPA